MSTWGGIGEGLTAGMNNRIALEMRERERNREQENWDRAFALREQAQDMAQADADRRFALQQQTADRTQANADRAFQQGERRLDMEQQAQDREFGLKQDDLSLRTDMANAELDLKREAQDWANQLNAERMRQFKTANDMMDAEWQKKQEVEAAQKESGRRQLALALYRVTGNGGEKKTITVNGANGQPQQVEANVLPTEQMHQIFGKDGYFRDVQNVVSFRDENGKTVAALVKPDGTMQTFDENALYDIYSSGVGKDFADGAMKQKADERDLGLFTKKEEAKAMAHAKAVMMSDQYGEKRRIDAATAVLKSYDYDMSNPECQNAVKYLGTVFSKANVEKADELAAMEAEAERRSKNRIKVVGNTPVSGNQNVVANNAQQQRQTSSSVPTASTQSPSKTSSAVPRRITAPVNKIEEARRNRESKIAKEDLDVINSARSLFADEVKEAKDFIESRKNEWKLHGKKPSAMVLEAFENDYKEKLKELIDKKIESMPKRNIGRASLPDNPFGEYDFDDVIGEAFGLEKPLFSSRSWANGKSGRRISK